MTAHKRPLLELAAEDEAIRLRAVQNSVPPISWLARSVAMADVLRAADLVIEAAREYTEHPVGADVEQVIAICRALGLYESAVEAWGKANE